MRIILFKIIFIHASIACFGQVVDTTAILFNSKLNTVNFSNILFDNELIEKLPLILNDTFFCKASILETVGFRDVTFVKVSFADEKFSEIIKYPIDNINNKIFDKEEIYFSNFVLAYSHKKNRFYKIKGFVNNEFDIFYYDYSITSDNLEKKVLRNRRSFLRNYKIEGIDLNCLYKSLRAKRKHSLGDYPCLEPNHTRMIIINGIPYYY
ncbi:MAG: hypothetical protein K0B09_10985 [Bacteroidales bacterium]|nr:hypothetical protein [Bacteroidales bacterium]